MIRLLLLTAIIAFSSCATKYETKCPTIKTIPRVSDVNFSVSDGCICGTDVYNVVNSLYIFRKHTDYYRETLEKYNKEFTDELK